VTVRTSNLLWFAKVLRKSKLSEPHPHNIEFGFSPYDYHACCSLSTYGA
jgi:hypothetical protein